MDLDKFLNLLATTFGTLGAVYVMMSIVAMTPDLMLKLTSPHWDYNLHQMDAIADQKADNIVGFVFVLMAFVLGFITIAFVPAGVQVFTSRWLPIVLVFVLTGAVSVTLSFIGEGYSKIQKRAIGIAAASHTLDDFIANGRLNPSDRASLDAIARDLLGMTLVSTESTRSLFERMAREAGKNLPSNFDYSAVEGQA